MSIRSNLRRWLEPVSRCRAARRPQRFRPTLECLEDRTVPSILFGNPRGETVSDGGGPVLTNAHVELIFWGSEFASTAAGQAATV